MPDREKVIKGLPDRCYDCKYCEQREQLSYMPYRQCTLADRMVYFSQENGWKRMVWCPLAKGEDND